MAMDIQKEYAMLQQQVKKCMQTNMPFDKYVKRQMQLVEQVKDEFVKNAGENIDDYLMELGYNSQLKTLSEKIGASTEKYVAKIKELTLKLGIEED